MATMDASVIELYEQLANAPDERTRARIIAEALQALSERFPHLDHLATRQHLSETELRLVKQIEQVRLEIEQVRLEIEQVRADLSKEIEQVRADLSKEIERVRADLSKEIERVRADLTRDIEALRVELVREIEQKAAEAREARSDLAVRIERAKSETIRWVAGLWLAQTALIAWLILRAAV
jgi:gas vesicle protein